MGYGAITYKPYAALGKDNPKHKCLKAEMITGKWQLGSCVATYKMENEGVSVTDSKTVMEVNCAVAEKKQVKKESMMFPGRVWDFPKAAPTPGHSKATTPSKEQNGKPKPKPKPEPTPVPKPTTK